MKILEINSCNFASTGNIMLQIQKKAEADDIQVLAAYPKSRSNLKKQVENSIVIGSILERNLHLLLAWLTGFNGCFSQIGTWLFLKRVSGYKPDLIHLHNLHNCYINLPMLFSYIKKNHIPVVWTLHDCWSFTGHCPHFTMAKCDKWKTGCENCPQYQLYPASKVDNSKKMWRLKKSWFTGVENLTIVTPSQWLADLVKESYLRDYSVQLIHNGIDLSVFHPTQSDFRENHHIRQKYLVLGVAMPWSAKKGLDVFIELSKRLPQEYQIVLVGTDDGVDQQLPSGILSIHRTNHQKELAEIYTAADVFFNPTREENYPTVNMEALACGTPVVTFDTGGSPEMLNNACGLVIPCGDLDAAEKSIRQVCENSVFSEESCLRTAESFDADERFAEYIHLYREMYHHEQDQTLHFK